MFIENISSFIFSNDDERINIKGYNLLREDQPSNKKIKGACIYYKEQLLITKIDVSCTLKEGLVTKIRVTKKKSCLYRLPSQTQNRFDGSCNDLDLPLSNINDVITDCQI